MIRITRVKGRGPKERRPTKNHYMGAIALCDEMMRVLGTLADEATMTKAEIIQFIEEFQSALREDFASGRES
jgi:hypothetical protein